MSEKCSRHSNMILIATFLRRQTHYWQWIIHQRLRMKPQPTTSMLQSALRKTSLGSWRVGPRDYTLLGLCFGNVATGNAGYDSTYTVCFKIHVGIAPVQKERSGTLGFKQKRVRLLRWELGVVPWSWVDRTSARVISPTCKHLRWRSCTYGDQKMCMML